VTSTAPARCNLGLWLLVSCALASQTAHAHDFPTAFKVLFQAGRPERTVVALRPGLALTESGGTSWDFLCGAASGLAGNDTYAALLTTEGHLLIAAFIGLYRDDGMGCGFSLLGNDTGLPAGKVVSLTLREDGSIRALTSLPGIDNGLYVSHDQGLHWTAHGAPLMAAMPKHLATTPSDPHRLYVTGLKANGAASTLWVSHDDGNAWTEKAMSLGPFFVQRAPEGTPLHDALIVSHDAGDTYAPVLEVLELAAMAHSPDGETLWVGSHAGGLYRAERGGTPQRIHETLQVGCLQYHDDVLWVCSRDQSGGDAPFALATSSDLGETWQPRLRSDQLRRLRTCGNPLQAMACSNEWNQWKWDVFGSSLAPPLAEPDAGTSAQDAQSAPPTVPSTDASVALDAGVQQKPTAFGAGCSLSPPTTRTRWWPAELLLAVLALRARLRAARRLRA